MAGTLRTTGSRALALGGAGIGCGAVAAALTARVAWLAGHAATARLDGLVELAVLAAGALALTWPAVSAGIAAACLTMRGAGHAWRRGEACVHRFAPTVVRRVLVAVLATGLGAASISTASAAGLPPPTSPTPTASAVASAVATIAGAATPDGAGVDLGWVVTAFTAQTAADDAGTASSLPVPPDPSPATAAAGADVPVTARPSATGGAGSGGDAPEMARPPFAAGASGQTAVTPRPAADDASGTEDATVVVLRGDTLWAIAARHLPPGASDAEVAAAWPAWYAANATTIGSDPGLILPGQVLAVPGVTR
ncbi:MAG TPA: hypothetical protein VGC04_15265 [Cellulomonas sp.]